MKDRGTLLSLLLFLCSIGIAAAGLAMIFGNRALIVWAFMHPAEGEVSNLFLAMLKQMGGLFLMLSLVLYFVAREPVRYIRTLDSFLVGLVILAFTPLLAVHTLDLRGTVLTAPGLWAKALARLAFVGVLYYLRPRAEEVTPWSRTLNAQA